MKKVLTLLIALIVTASVSFAASNTPANNDVDVSNVVAFEIAGYGPNADHSNGYWKVYTTPSNNSDVDVSNVVAFEIAGYAPNADHSNGYWTTVSIEDNGVDYSSIDTYATNVEGLVSQMKQLEQAQLSHDNIADTEASTTASHI
jgi:hypothetical protein